MHGQSFCKSHSTRDTLQAFSGSMRPFSLGPGPVLSLFLQDSPPLARVSFRESAAARLAARPSAASASSAAASPRRVRLQMTSEVSQPIAFVKCSGQESFPKFKLMPVTAWPGPADPVLEAIKAENRRRDQKRATADKVAAREAVFALQLAHV